MTVIDAARPHAHTGPGHPPPADRLATDRLAADPTPPGAVPDLSFASGAACAEALGAGRVGVARGEVAAGVGTRLRGSAGARRVALAVGGFLLPWCAVLALTLPRTAQAQNWSMAWVGLDAAEAVAALATAVLLARADARAALTAVAGGVLLTIDAWFDVCTSAPGLDHTLSLAEAGFLELPLAAAAFWLALTLIRRPTPPR